MQRHICNKHGNDKSFSFFSRIYSTLNSIDKCNSFHFVHPSTCMGAGMTGSGKDRPGLNLCCSRLRGQSSLSL